MRGLTSECYNSFPHSFSLYTLCMLLPYAYYFLLQTFFPFMSCLTDSEYFTLPHAFRADSSRFRVESEWNGRNGWNLVGMKC